ncbi:hypothetical protein ACX0HA_01930 [Flavobacterium hauense]
MKKLFFALFALTALVSCSDDDTNSTNNEETQKFVTSMIIGEGEDAEMITFQYDDNKNLKTYLEDGDVSFTFTYNSNNELVTITDAFDESSSVEIQYTNGVLSGYTIDGSTFPITYNEETKKYLFGGFGIEVGLEGRDIGTVAEADEEDYVTIDYFDAYKGPMYNVPTKDIFLVSLFTDLYYLTSTKSISGMNDEGQNYSTESTYDEDGYVTKMILKSGSTNEDVITFQYSEL